MLSFTRARPWGRCVHPGSLGSLAHTGGLRVHPRSLCSVVLAVGVEGFI